MLILGSVDLSMSKRKRIHCPPDLAHISSGESVGSSSDISEVSLEWFHEDWDIMNSRDQSPDRGTAPQPGNTAPQPGTSGSNTVGSGVHSLPNANISGLLSGSTALVPSQDLARIITDNSKDNFCQSPGTVVFWWGKSKILSMSKCAL